MYRGGTLIRPTIAYETWGTLAPDASNAILIFTGLSPSAHATLPRTRYFPGLSINGLLHVNSEIRAVSFTPSATYAVTCYFGFGATQSSLLVGFFQYLPSSGVTHVDA